MDVEKELVQMRKDLEGFMQICCESFVAIQKLLGVDHFDVEKGGE